MTGSRSRIVFAPLPEDGPSQRQPEIALAKKHLARHPGVPFEQGLEWTIAYFERLLREAPGAPPEHRTALGAEP